MVGPVVVLEIGSTRLVLTAVLHKLGPRSLWAAVSVAPCGEILDKMLHQRKDLSRQWIGSAPKLGPDFGSIAHRNWVHIRVPQRNWIQILGPSPKDIAGMQYRLML